AARRSPTTADALPACVSTINASWPSFKPSPLSSTSSATDASAPRIYSTRSAASYHVRTTSPANSVTIWPSCVANVWSTACPRPNRFVCPPGATASGFFFLRCTPRLYGPLTAATLEPYVPDEQILTKRCVKLDRLYAAVDQTLKKLSEHLGIAQPA